VIDSLPLLFPRIQGQPESWRDHAQNPAWGILSVTEMFRQLHNSGVIAKKGTNIYGGILTAGLVLRPTQKISSSRCQNETAVNVFST